MPQNPIQFQHGMSMNEFIAAYGTEAQCAAALQQARWPDGFVCPECGGREHSRFLADGRRYWQCSTCRSQSSVCSGTLFHASKLPLTKWFQAIYLVTQNKSNISALSLKRSLGVCYRTAWRVKHKLLEAMAARESYRLLTGVVPADDAFSAGCTRANRVVARRTKRPSWRRSSSTTTATQGKCASTRSTTTRGPPSRPGRSRHFTPRHIWSPMAVPVSTPPAPRSLPTARSSSATTNPARWSRLLDPDRGRQAAGPRGRAPVVDPEQQVLGIPRHAGVGGLREADASRRAPRSGEATRASGLHPLLAIGIFVVFPAIHRFQDVKGGLSWVRSLRAGVTARSRSAADRHTKGPAQVLADQGSVASLAIRPSISDRVGSRRPTASAARRAWLWACETSPALSS